MMDSQVRGASQTSAVQTADCFWADGYVDVRVVKACDTARYICRACSIELLALSHLRRSFWGQ